MKTTINSSSNNKWCNLQIDNLRFIKTTGIRVTRQRRHQWQKNLEMSESMEGICKEEKQKEEELRKGM